MKYKTKKTRAIITRKRSLKILPPLFSKDIFVHNGKTIIKVGLKRSLLGQALGTLSLTKKLGKTIHDSERNRKRKNKKKQKK